MNTSTRIRKAGILVLLGPAAPLVGCIDSTEPAETLFWQGLLEPSMEATVQLSGGMAMMAEANFTLIAVEVEGGEAGDLLAWTVRAGSCGAGGDVVGPPGTFPDLALDETGSVEAQAALSRRLPDRDVYAGEVKAAPGDGGQLLACANLVRFRP